MLKMMFFYREGDIQSKMQEEFLRTLEATFKGRVTFERIDTLKDKEKANRYKVNGTPTIIIEKDGRVTDRFLGFTQELFLKRALERNL